MIVSALDGHLECDAHPLMRHSWCDHIAEYVAKVRDAALIHPVTETTIIQCPMLPADLRLFHEVYLEPVVARVEGLCVIEHEFQGVAYQAGHLMPGEGRGVIRENLVQWMVSIESPDDIKCKASSHNFSDMSRLSQMRETRLAAWLMECWCMFSTDMCTNCYRKYLDISDVIPTGS